MEMHEVLKIRHFFYFQSEMNVNYSNDIDTDSVLRRYYRNAIISMAFINVGK